jgi:hypothetical protein
MANLQFQDLQNEVYAHASLDASNATNATNVSRWINYVQQDICSRWPWPFMLGQETLVTIPDYTTGTVSVNASSGTVTGVGTAFTSTQADGTYFIQFNTANDWYPVTARSSGTSITITPVYAQTTNLSGSAFTLRKFYYSLSSAVDEIIDIRNWDTPVKLIQVDPRFIDGLNPNPQSTNSSYAYMTYGYDSSGNLRFSPYPYPSDARLFNFRTKIRPVDMVNTTDLPSIPNKYAYVIAWGAIAIGLAYKNDMERAAAWSAKYEQRLQQMKGEYRQSEDNQPVLTSIDSVQRSKWISMPESYPVISSR